MLHNTLSALLVSVASRYAELSPADVGIGIGGGRLVIDDVKLRAHTFNSPRLPFHVHQGRAGRLRVNVPWSALSSSPVEVYLENVHLIAGPKQRPTPGEVPSDGQPDPEAAGSKDVSEKGSPRREKGAWHQTAVGRLAFNVSVEMYGLKVEYRDASCVGVISIATLRAFSAGRDWKSRFVSLALDPDADSADTTTAVAMRKLVKLAGVHWVMIPRRSPVSPDDGPDNTHPELDLQSFESQSPIVDGIVITVRVLLCTGKASTQANPRHVTPGLHAEIEVDLEDPNVNLTARQIKWIDHILKQGLGLGSKMKRSSSQPMPGAAQNLHLGTKRRPRSVPPSDSSEQLEDQDGVNGKQHDLMENDISSLQEDGDLTKPELLQPESDTDSKYSAQNPKGDTDEGYDGEAVDAEIEEVSDFDEEEEYREADIKASDGGLLSFWRAIVGENSDETVDDAAVALGLSNGYGGSNDNEDSFEEQEEDQSDYLYAKSAVAAAANAGGLTMQLRVKTPDMAAWDLVDSLRDELGREREVRIRLENLEAVLEEAEERVRASEEEARQLRERNDALMQELQDLERMTSQAGKNKDAMIRQMEAALTKAERNLQALFQAQFEQQRDAARSAAQSPCARVEERPPSVAENVSQEGDVLVELSEQRVVVASPGADGESVALVSVESSDAHGEGELGEESGDGYVESASELPVADMQSLLQAPASAEAGQDVAGISGDVGSGQDPFSPVGMQEIPIRHRTDEEYLVKLSSQKLEEAMSSEGLTLI